MAAPKRTPFQRERDLERTTSLYLKGKTQQEIADELNVSREQIKYDLKVIQERWRNDTTINLDEAKQRELSRIDELERTYWQAWERSLDERTKTRTEKYSGEDGKGKASIEKETLLGLPAYLTGIQWCISERCKILGLYAPIKNATTDKDGNDSPLTIEVRHIDYRDGLAATQE